jgi:hypothetical protein
VLLCPASDAFGHGDMNMARFRHACWRKRSPTAQRCQVAKDSSVPRVQQRRSRSQVHVVHARRFDVDAWKQRCELPCGNSVIKHVRGDHVECLITHRRP